MRIADRVGLGVALAIGLAGCAAETDAGGAVAAGAPALGAADGADTAERRCQVVLRTVERVPGPTGGVETDCRSGRCWLVWRVLVDVADVAVDAGGHPFVLFSSSFEPGMWFEMGGTRVDGAGPGFERFEVRLAEHTVEAGVSAGALARTRIELVPFLRLRGVRHFDHNRLPGDLDNYVLSRENGWTIADEVAVCPPAESEVDARATIAFRPDWEEVQEGAIVEGGTLRIEYALARMPQCFGVSYMGYSAWDTVAHVVFHPGGELVERSVKGRRDFYGQDFFDLPLEVHVPRGADRVEVWFSHSGRGCMPQWDSAFGANYHFDVAPTPSR